MTRRVPLAIAAAACAVLALPASAKDYGREGAVFPVVEADLLSVIHQRLTAMQASGEIDRANRQLAERTAAKVRRPAAVPGIVTAEQERRWLFDPTITVGQDLRDARGRVIVAAGTRVNPLDTVPLRQKLLFLDGDDAGQVAWAMRSTTALSAKLILVRGSPFALMKADQRRYYFDQQGTLTRRLGISAVPALVEQQGRALLVRELVVASVKGDRG